MQQQGIKYLPHCELDLMLFARKKSPKTYICAICAKELRQEMEKRNKLKRNNKGGEMSKLKNNRDNKRQPAARKTGTNEQSNNAREQKASVSHCACKNHTTSPPDT